MEIIGLNTSIWKNKMRLLYLILLLPIVVCLGILLFLLIIHGGISNQLFQDFISLNILIGPFLLLWLIIGIYFQKQIIFKYTGAKEITRGQEPKIYNIVENLCISRGLTTPKIGIIEERCLNAFATGWSKKKSWIVFSRGLLDTLEHDEIEAVAGHELTHIINGDVKNMVIINVFIGAIGSIGYILMRSWSYRNNGWKNPLPILGIILYIISISFLPLINLAISRKKEFLADAGSVDLTKNSDAMIRALQKISQASTIKSVQNNTRSVANMFICDPKHNKKLFSEFRYLFSTHPSIESRIELLKKY